MHDIKRSQITVSVSVMLASLALMASTPAAAQSDKTDAWELVIGPTAFHWSNEENHSRVVLLGLERGWSDGAMAGLSVFQNSFSQPCAYAYYGHTWDDVLGMRDVYVKLSGGIIYGYKGQYANKIPFNHSGFGLGVIPALGYRITPRDAVQVGVLGKAALIFTYNRRF